MKNQPVRNEFVRIVFGTILAGITGNFLAQWGIRFAMDPDFRAACAEFSPARLTLVVGAVLTYALVALARYLFLLLRPLPPRDVALDPEAKAFSLADHLLLVPIFHSSVRVSIATAVVVAVFVFALLIPFVPPFLIGVVMAITVVGWLVLFAARYAGIKESVDRSMDQILATLGSQIEDTIFEARGHKKDYRLRCQVMVYDPKARALVPGSSYRMTGEPDSALTLGPRQCVRGRAYTEAEPYLSNPYDPEALGLSPEQIDKMPGIRWMAAFPILDDDKEPVGCLSIDCNKGVPQEWLDKIVDFCHATASAMGIIGSLEKR